MGNDDSQETIKVSTSRFGELEVPTSSVIRIVNGLIGFPTATKYTLLEYNPPFSWLQSTENPDLAFVVVNGAEFGEGYTFQFPIGDRDLELTEDDEVAIVNLVSVRSDPTQTTVNLKAPIIVNLSNMCGRQIVLDDQRFPVRLPLWTPDAAGSESKEKTAEDK